MKIVVLDGFALNPGDLEWEAFEDIGELVVYERSENHEVIERVGDTRIVLVNKTDMLADTFRSMPNLRYIGVLATGYDNVDVDAAREHGVTVTNVPEYGTMSVAQCTMAHLLHICNRIAEHGASVNDGEWQRSADYSYWKYPLIELAGMTMGIVGLGRIGAATAAMAQAMGMKVIACNSRDTRDQSGDIEMVDMRTLFANSDVVSLHCPLTDENRGFVDRELISTMKRSAILINTSRGALINEHDLARCLREKRIAAASLDVLSVEPPKDGSPLIGLENCHLTPHIAWATRAARSRLMDTACENLRAFLQDKPINVVS